MESALSQFELIIGLIIWVWIFVSSFLFNYLENSCIDNMQKHSDSEIENPSKNSWINPFGGFKNLLFFITYKPKTSDSTGFVVAAKNGKVLQAVYFIQLICVVGVFIAFKA